MEESRAKAKLLCMALHTWAPHLCTSPVDTPRGACQWPGTDSGAPEWQERPIYRDWLERQDCRKRQVDCNALALRGRDLCRLGNKGRLLGSGPEGQVRFVPMGKRGKTFQFGSTKADTLSSNLSCPKYKFRDLSHFHN